jgi:hypothetical protein
MRLGGIGRLSNVLRISFQSPRLTWLIFCRRAVDTPRAMRSFEPPWNSIRIRRKCCAPARLHIFENVRSRRKLGDAEALLEKYLASQTTPDDPAHQETCELLTSARNLHLKSRDRE